MMTTRPRFHGRRHDVALEACVVDALGIGHLLADLVPGTVVGLGESAHHLERLLGRQLGAVLDVLDEVGVEGVLAGRAVAGDVAGAAVDEVGAGDGGGRGREDAPDAHAVALGFDVDADGATGPGSDPVRADDDVVAPGRPVGEGHLDAVVVLCEIGAGGGEADLGSGLGRPVDEDLGELGAVHAEGRGQVRAAGLVVVELEDEGAAGSGRGCRGCRRRSHGSRTWSQTPSWRSTRSALPWMVMPEPRAATSGFASTTSTEIPVGEQDRGDDAAGGAGADDENLPHC